MKTLQDLPKVPKSILHKHITTLILMFRVFLQKYQLLRIHFSVQNETPKNKDVDRVTSAISFLKKKLKEKKIKKCFIWKPKAK